MGGDEDSGSLTAARPCAPARRASSGAPGCSSRSGTIPRSELLLGQVDLDADGYVLVDGRSAPAPTFAGVFACGDLVDHTYRQAVTAAGSGCRAALDAERFLAELHDEAQPPVR